MIRPHSNVNCFSLENGHPHDACLRLGIWFGNLSRFNSGVRIREVLLPRYRRGARGSMQLRHLHVPFAGV